MSISGRDIAKAASDYDGHDHSWWVYSKELKIFIPLPAGKVPVIDDYPIPLAPSDDKQDFTSSWPAQSCSVRFCSHCCQLGSYGLVVSLILL